MKLDKVNSNKLILQSTDSKAKYNIVFNDRVVAEVLLDIDGFYKLQIEGGLWESYHVLEIAKLVIDLNKPYEEELKAYFDKQEFSNNEFNTTWSNLLKEQEKQFPGSINGF